MSLPLTRDAVLALLDELEVRMLMRPQSVHLPHRKQQRQNLLHARGILDQPAHNPAVVLQDAKLHRLAAFALLSYLKLPRDLLKVGPALAELAELGFDMVGLEARSVFEEPVTGADFV